MTYQNLQDIESDYASAIEDEDGGKIEQGRIIADGIDALVYQRTMAEVQWTPHADVADLAKHMETAAALNKSHIRREVLTRCAELGGQSDRTVRDRERVYRIFQQPNRYSKHIRHSLHVLCCTDTDVDNSDTWDAAYKWLEIAEAGYTDANGNVRPHSYATLKARIVASGKDPDKGETVYLLDNAKATITNTRVSGSGQHYIEFQVDELPAVGSDAPVYLTLTQVLAKEKIA